MSITDAVREESTKYGFGVILTGTLLFLGLRLWTSPVVRIIIGRERNGLASFLLIPILLVVVAIGVVLFLWEPDR